MIPGSSMRHTRVGWDESRLHKNAYLLAGTGAMVAESIDDIYLFFSRPENLQVITPSWLDFRMVEAPETLGVGSLIRYRLRWRGLPIRWTTEISEWNPPHGFVDREVSGPYAMWNHEHWFATHDG